MSAIIYRIKSCFLLFNVDDYLLVNYNCIHCNHNIVIFLRFCALLQVVGINFICHVLYHVSILNRGIIRIIHLFNLPDVSLCPTNFSVLFLLVILTSSLILRFGRIGNAAFRLIKSVLFLELIMLSISCLLKLYYLFYISYACGEGLSRLGTI